MNDITLRQLKIFSLIVEQGSFARCADFLGISPVAISEHIKKLELRLDHKLFKRHKGEIAVLTESGADDYKRISGILSEIALLQNDPNKELNEIAPRTLKVGADSVIFESVRKSITAIKSMYPHIEVNFKLDINTPSAIEQKLNEHEIDIGYFYASEGTYHNTSTFVCHEPLAIYVGESHILTNKSTVSIADLSQTPSIQGSKNSYICQLVNNALAQAGLSNFPVALESDHFGLRLSSLHENKGFQCMYERTAKMTPYTEKLACLNVSFSIPSLQLRQIVHPSLKYDPFVHDVTKLMNSTLM